MTPHAWLAQWPLQPGERLYVIISAASDAPALTALYPQGMTADLIPIWRGTPYADWLPVMPYLAELQPDAACLQWIAQTDAQDWGWLAVAICEPDVLFQHLRSLTQVRMPDGTEVFFRFWDGRHLLPILQGLGQAASELLPVVNRYLINGQALEIEHLPVPQVKDWPWWQVPETLLHAVLGADPTAVIDNMMQWLRQAHADLYFSFPESVLRAKVRRFVTRTPLDQEDFTGRLKAHLQQEVAL